ncbi:hypothetical protein Acor_40880 [Acrocarpospora corrugata]|uniref:Uncharacterized protein n=1 Tax=Acrocarpospora corrugata TaxID=35763 RepID=A0A5M3W401_9ACTN|nr:hypothetical protein [Acrocarpospora corrugata]GES02023.1 hypothetical protein Acor_40880 [Acrocarpospora corrugata]
MTIHATEIRAMESAPADLAGITDTDVPTHAPDIAPHVADTVAAPMQDGQAGEGTNARQDAVWRALMASPGGSATEIGVAAGLSRAMTSKILNGWESEGRVVRTPGGNDGPNRTRTPDRWHPISHAPGTTDEHVPDADETPTDTGTPDDLETATESQTGLVTGPDLSAATDTVPHEVTDSNVGDHPEEGDAESADEPSAYLDGQTELEEATDGPDAEHAPADVIPSDAVPDSEPEVGADTALDETPQQDADEPTAVEDPEWAQARAELLELADLILGAVTAKDGNDDAVMALGRLEMAMAKASQVHRSARAVLTGTTNAPVRTAPRPGAGSGGGGVRPGMLRDRVLGHLIEHPGKEFTPYEIGRVLDASSGAVANALDRLVSLDQAQLTCERPRRFAAPTSALGD